MSTPRSSGQPDGFADTQVVSDLSERRQLVITAIVFIQADVARIPEVAEKIAALDGVSEVYSVTGEIDLVAMVRVRTHEAVADVVADRLNKIEGVLNTETHIAFRAYSRHDLEAAFALGAEGG
nr:Lrp/AsnC ligand binding domain-containing protein [Phytoactinopolyspora mesophila]